MLVALWARFVWRERVPRRVWLALGLVLVGLVLVAQVWAGLTLDGLGVAAGLAAAVALAVYYLTGERLVVRRDPFSLVCFAIGVGGRLLGRRAAVVELPVRRARRAGGAAHGLWTTSARLGAGALDDRARHDRAVRRSRSVRCSHLPATTVRIVATFEPVAAAVVAWVWLGETLGRADRRRRGRAGRDPARRDLALTPDRTYPVGMVERVLLASPRGYCAGVERAVETVEQALEHYGAPVYVRKQIVHNIHVVRDLEARGAIFVEEETEVPAGATVVYSAHGVAPSVHENSRAARAQRDRRHLPARDEGARPGAAVRGERLHRDPDRPRRPRGGRRARWARRRRRRCSCRTWPRRRRSTCPPTRRVAYITQTTLSVDETAEIIGVLRRRFPRISGRRRKTSVTRPPTASGP